MWRLLPPICFCILLHISLSSVFGFSSCRLRPMCLHGVLTMHRLVRLLLLLLPGHRSAPPASGRLGAYLRLRGPRPEGRPYRLCFVSSEFCISWSDYIFLLINSSLKRMVKRIMPVCRHAQAFAGLTPVAHSLYTKK